MSHAVAPIDAPAASTRARSATAGATPPTEFSHRLALAYVDLDELPALLGGRLLRRGPGLLRFRRRDYLGDRDAPLDEAVRDRVARADRRHRPDGPIRLLTQLRSFGLCFNPVSFYYCLDATGERVEACSPR